MVEPALVPVMIAVVAVKGVTETGGKEWEMVVVTVVVVVIVMVIDTRIIIVRDSFSGSGICNKDMKERNGTVVIVKVVTDTKYG